MPRLSRFFIRSALGCLATGFTIGGLILSAKGGAVTPRVWGWLGPHIAILIFGWLVQLALGVAYWILPRILDADRGRPAWAWGSFAAYQTGLALIGLSLAGLWVPAAHSLLAPGIMAIAAGVVMFAVHAWPRVKPLVVRAALGESR